MRTFGRCLALVIVVAGFAAPAARAQNRPTVFMHGFGAEASDWALPASELETKVAIDPRMPNLPWREEYAKQANDVQAKADFRNLPGNTVAVGHSNGGIVAREWNKLHGLGGIVTIGTPHLGAPIVAQMPAWSIVTSATFSALNRVVNAFNHWSDWVWVWAFLDSTLRWVSDFTAWSAVNLVGAIGMQTSIPVAYQMLPGSSYLNALNSSGNLGRESTEVPHRVGIASVARNFFFAGPARAIAPDQADAIATAMYGAAFGLMFWGNYILTTAPPADVAAMEQGMALTGLAFQILAIDPFYCRMVSAVNRSECVPNDGIVPVDSQLYPGAPNILLGGDNDGPAHSQEKQRGGDALYAALVHYMHLPPRTAAAPTPSPTPTPPPAPEPEASDPEPAPESTPDPDPPVSSATGVLRSGESLMPGESVDSTDGRMHLAYQGDGNLVLYDASGTPLWASDTAGMPAGFVAMQGDGNLVVYTPDGVPLWSSDASLGHAGAWLAVQNDGNVVIYDADGTPLWSTDTFVQ